MIFDTIPRENSGSWGDIFELSLFDYSWIMMIVKQGSPQDEI
jgi:hypothetical protein